MAWYRTGVLPQVGETDRAYVAGIIDGEGYINILRKRGTRKFQVSVGVGMATRPVIDFLHKTFGGSIILIPARRPNQRPNLRWRVCSSRASWFLKLILPFLVLKKEHAENAIKVQRLLQDRQGGHPAQVHLCELIRLTERQAYLNLRGLVAGVPQLEKKVSKQLRLLDDDDPKA